MPLCFARCVGPALLVAAASVGFAQSAPAGTAGAPPAPAGASAQTVPLIPRDVLFGNPDRTALRISPDGKQLAWIAPVAGVLNVWVAPSDNPAAGRPVTSDTLRGIRSFFWAFTSNHILYLQDKGGDENFKLYVVDLKTNQAKDLTPFDSINGPDGKPIMLPTGQPLRPTVQIEEVSHRYPETILIGLNNRNPQLHDLYRLNILTGEMKLVQQNEGFTGFSADDEYNIRLAARMTADGGSELLKPDGPAGDTGFAKWQPFTSISMADSLTTAPVGFDRTGTVLYMLDSRNRDTAAVVAVDISSGNSKLLAEDARADAGGVLIHPTTRVVQAVGFNYKRQEWKVLDSSIQADLDYLRTVADGDISISSRTLDDSRWTVSYLMDNGPARVYVYDRAAKKAEFIFSNRKDLEGQPLQHMTPVVIKSRDGLDMVSYLTLPAGADADGNGRPDKPVPMVLNVHGGPWARDAWGMNPEHQWLANRGYAVLSVNFRGSTGFGKSFINAGNREWAAKMHDDLIDAVNWAVAEKIADPAKVAIYGGSYGGYSALVGVTFTPDVFACSVAIVGPSNLVTLLNSLPPHWLPMVEMFSARVGDHRTEEGRKFLESRSPLNFVDRIKRPLLIGQGKNDPRVKFMESEQVVSAMRSKNIPVTYVLYPDEGHGFARPPNRMSFYAVAEAFLAQHLGGRFEPVGDDFKGASIQVPEGAQHVPGLRQALSEAAK